MGTKCSSELKGNLVLKVFNYVGVHDKFCLLVFHRRRLYDRLEEEGYRHKKRQKQKIMFKAI
jgi:hypothetical protein